MYICPKCNHTSENPANFCPICGNQVLLKEEQHLTPDYITAQPDYMAPTPKPSLATKIVGMALSIEGFVMAMFSTLYVLIFLIGGAASGEIAFGAGAFGSTFVWALLGLPSSIIGLIFSNKALAFGDTSVMSRVGRALGLAGVITFGACFVISFFAIISIGA